MEKRIGLVAVFTSRRGNVGRLPAGLNRRENSGGHETERKWAWGKFTGVVFYRTQPPLRFTIIREINGWMRPLGLVGRCSTGKITFPPAKFNGVLSVKRSRINLSGEQSKKAEKKTNVERGASASRMEQEFTGSRPESDLERLGIEEQRRQSQAPIMLGGGG